MITQLADVVRFAFVVPRAKLSGKGRHRRTGARMIRQAGREAKGRGAHR